MDLIHAKQLEYSLDIHRELAIADNNPVENYPNLEIVWNLNGNLITCNTFKYLDPKSPTKYPILKEDLKNGYFVPKSSTFSDLDDDPFYIARNSFFDTKDNRGMIVSLYKEPEHLLKYLINFVSNLDSIKNSKDIDKYTLYNVHRLNDSKKLDFLLIDENVTLDPVSLISTATS